MNCARFKEIENKNLFDKLSPAEEKEMREHIKVCAPCRKVYGEYRYMSALLKPATYVPEPAYIKERVNARLDKESVKPSLFDFLFGYGHNPVKAGLVVGVGLLAVVVLSANLFSLNTKKPAKYETYYAASVNTVYAEQFYLGNGQEFKNN